MNKVQGKVLTVKTVNLERCNCEKLRRVKAALCESALLVGGNDLSLECLGRQYLRFHITFHHYVLIFFLFILIRSFS